MILDIDNKLLQSSIKTITKSDVIVDAAIVALNKYANDHKLDLTYVRSHDINKLETRNREKIIQIIKRDRLNKLGRTK